MTYAVVVLLGNELVGTGESPCPRDAEDIGIPGDIGGKRCEWPGEPDDIARRLVEDFPARRAVDFDFINRTVRLDRYRDHQAAVDSLIARDLRIVQLAHALDFEAPVFDIAGKAELLGARTDETTA